MSEIYTNLFAIIRQLYVDNMITEDQRGYLKDVVISDSDFVQIIRRKNPEEAIEILINYAEDYESPQLSERLFCRKRSQSFNHLPTSGSIK
ncbi:hypothetical protein pb186bvf_006419 [Paramecium bursaria]